MDALIAKTLNPEEAIRQQELTEQIETLLQRLSTEKGGIIDWGIDITINNMGSMSKTLFK
ncbi:MAG: hypothetical protein AAF846_27525 [Chloroflexota bacterium]